MSETNCASSFQQILEGELQELEKRERLRQLQQDPAETPREAEGSASALYPTRKKQLSVKVAALDAEKKYSEESGDSIHRANKKNLFGLAFSGGGIRSATFNLGILQGLARRKLLRRVDYLSTISGGGYIGSWLAAWIYRRGMLDVERLLSADRKDQVNFKSPRELEFLREYSNYLTPRKGFLGADTWAALAIYLRNLLLNQTILILFIAAMLLVPRALFMFVTHVPAVIKDHPILFRGLPFLAICGIGGFLIFKSMRNYTTDPKPDRVLARVVTVLEKRTIKADPDNPVIEQDIRVLLTPDASGDETAREKFEALLETLPRIEVWNKSITRRTSKGGCELLKVERESPESLNGVMTLRIKGRAAPVEDGNLIIAVYPWSARPAGVYWFAVVPIFVGSILLSNLLAWYGDRRFFQWADLSSGAWWSAAGAVCLFLLWACAFLVFGRNLDQSAERGYRKVVAKISAFLSPLIGGAVGGLLIWQLAHVLIGWGRLPAGMWKVLGFGTPLVALTLLAATTVQIGIMGDVFSEPRREWWGRLAGSLMIFGFLWSAVFTLAGYAPLWIMQLVHSYPRSKWIAAASWALSTGAGVFGAKSSGASSPDSHSTKDIALSVTPYIFIVGLLSLLAWGIHLSPLTHGKLEPAPPTSSSDVELTFSAHTVLHETGTPTLDFHLVSQPPKKQNASESYWREVAGSDPLAVYAALACCFLASLLLAFRVDLNEFSMHYLYRNRLVRCYLGASHRERVPNPFTGFDENDDIALADLRTEKSYDGPIPILGAALNLVHGKELAWQERKAESFTMTPLTCGFDVWYEKSQRPGQNEKSKLDPFGYRPTDEFAYPGGLFLGTAMAISGAAASPNMGYHSSPALSFLLTVFNVRLGWWVGNPRRPDRWQNPGPFLGLLYLLAELFGYTDDTGAYVYLSDGGHFENLGLYELVKRRCRFIIASDADADKALSFGDLASAIRKCRSDMGIEIKIRTDHLVASGTPPFSKWHCTIADILYSKSDSDAADGVLLYVKASLTSDEPADILNYKSQYEDFPHQSTADQWFTESQFESYRALGEHVIESALAPIDPANLSTTDIDTIAQRLKRFWNNREQISINW